MADQSKTDGLRAMRERNWANRNKPKATPFEDAARGRDPIPERKQPKAKPTKPDDVPASARVVSRLGAGRTAQDVPQPSSAGAVAIPKLGRPRLGEKRDKPWLHTKPPMSKTTYYRRKAEGTLP